MAWLILMRHGKAERPHPGRDDFDRALIDRGKMESAAAARAILETAPAPRRILVSPARRTRETASCVASALAAAARDGMAEKTPAPPIPIRENPALYLADRAQILDAIEEDDRSETPLLVIGHNPGIQECADWLAGSGHPAARQRLAMGFPTAALAILRIPDPREDGLIPGSGILESLIFPKDLPKAGR